MSGRKGVFVAVFLLVALGIGLIIWSSMGLSRHTGEICITYNGRTECRVASGSSREEAIRTATDMACSVLSSGMTDRIQCTSRQPTSVDWDVE